MSFPPMPPGGTPRRPDPVALAWIGGIALAVLAYAVGPEHFIARVVAAVSQAGWVLEDMVHNLTQTAFDAMRAASIGLYGVYAALTAIAIGRGGGGRFGLVAVTVVFLLLVWGAWGDATAINARWLAALVLTGLSALSATRRVAHGPR